MRVSEATARGRMAESSDFGSPFGDRVSMSIRLSNAWNGTDSGSSQGPAQMTGVRSIGSNSRKRGLGKVFTLPALHGHKIRGERSVHQEPRGGPLARVYDSPVWGCPQGGVSRFQTPVTLPDPGRPKRPPVTPQAGVHRATAVRPAGVRVRRGCATGQGRMVRLV